MKKLFNSITLSVMSLFFVGCGGFPLLIHTDPTLKTDYIGASVPKLNTVNKAEVGQNMYSKANLYYGNTYDVFLKGTATGKKAGVWVDSSANVKTSAGAMHQYERKYYTKLRKLDNTINAMCYTEWICLTDLNSDKQFTHFSALGDSEYGKLDIPVKYEILQTKEFQQDSFKYEALYQGKKGNVIKISFREFKDNMARPAFTQDIEYELDENSKAMIGFKGLRIEVLEATNFDITYVVIKDYD